MDANGRLNTVQHRQQMDRRAQPGRIKSSDIIATVVSVDTPITTTISGQTVTLTSESLEVQYATFLDGVTQTLQTSILTTITPEIPPSTSKSPTSKSNTETPIPPTTDPTTSPAPTSSSKPGSHNGQGSSSQNGSISSDTGGDSSGISSGAAAGIGVGCAVAGAAIAAILFLILFRKRSRNPAASRSPGAYSGAAYGEKGDSKGLPLTDVSALGSSALIEDHLPQPVEDGALSGELSKINSLIKNHVNSYYDLTGAKTAPALSAFGNNTPIHPEVLAGHLTNPATRAAALRFCVAWTLFGRAANGSDELSLIPASLAASQGSMSGLRGKSEARQALLGRWRAITGALWESDTARDAPSKQALLDALEDLVEPFAAKPSMERERVQNLEVIISRAQNLAFLVFRQPSLFSYDWDTPPNGTAVTFPGMLQVTDEKGQWLRPAREVAKKTTDSQLK